MTLSFTTTPRLGRRTRSAGKPARLRQAVTVVVIALGLSTFGMPRAEANEVQIIAAVVNAAYSAYKELRAGSLTLQQATDQIQASIHSAQTAIINHVDRVASAEARACAKAAVIDLADIESFLPETQQAFARDATACATLHESLLSAVADKGSVDQLGFSVNALGPVALLARQRVGWSTTGLRSSLTAANNTVVTKLTPSCQANPLRGDAEPGGIIEVLLRCNAYNGDIGTDTAFTRDPRRRTYDFTDAAREAVRNTSHPVATAALAQLAGM